MSKLYFVPNYTKIFEHALHGDRREAKNRCGLLQPSELSVVSVSDVKIMLVSGRMHAVSHVGTNFYIQGDLTRILAKDVCFFPFFPFRWVYGSTSVTSITWRGRSDRDFSWLVVFPLVARILHISLNCATPKIDWPWSSLRPLLTGRLTYIPFCNVT